MYLSVVAIDARPSNVCTARRLRVPPIGPAGETDLGYRPANTGRPGRAPSHIQPRPKSLGWIVPAAVLGDSRRRRRVDVSVGLAGRHRGIVFHRGGRRVGDREAGCRVGCRARPKRVRRSSSNSSNWRLDGSPPCSRIERRTAARSPSSESMVSRSRNSRSACRSVRCRAMRPQQQVSDCRVLAGPAA